MEKVIVAMSGGVDSSLAAALLKDDGYDVVGITMQIWPRGHGTYPGGFGGCCGTDAIEDARKVAYRLGIPHYVLNFRDLFARTVIADFYQEYGRGRTPNPCIRCNQYVKFDGLLKKARGLGFDFIATGHHARIESNEITERITLTKGLDAQKDQSYFLYTLTQEQLEHTLFPIGNFTKKEVRAMARERKLPVADRPESQDICFVPDNNYAEFLKDFIPQAFQPGLMLDEQGNILGRHRGIANYTIGQRKGLGIATGEPQYVIAIESKGNAVIVGGRERVFGDELVATQMNWIAIEQLTGAIAVKARIRYRHPEAAATITPVDKDIVYVKFKKPQSAITPGQAVVFYDGDKVLGGGTIASSGKSPAPEQIKELARNG